MGVKFVDLDELAEQQESNGNGHGYTRHLDGAEVDNPDALGRWYSHLWEQHPEGGGYYGGRDNALHAYTRWLRGVSRIPFEKAMAEALNWNDRFCDPPIEPARVRDLVARSWAQYAADVLPEITPEMAAGIDPENFPEPMTPAQMRAEYERMGGFKWLYKNCFVEGGLHLIVGKPAGGKSISISHLIHCATTGRPWFHGLNGGDERPGIIPVMYVDEEMGIQSTWTRLAKMGLPDDAPLYYYGREGLHISNKQHVQGLLKRCQRLGVKMIIFDTLIRCTSYDENSNTEMRKVYHDVTPFLKAGIAVVLIHHGRKGQAQGGPDHEAARGAGDIIGMADMAFMVQRTDESTFRMNVIKPRLISEQDAIDVTYRIVDSEDRRRMTVTEVSPEQAEAERERSSHDEVLTALASGPKGTEDIMKALGGNRSERTALVKSMAEAGLIRTWKESRKIMYGLPADAPSSGLIDPDTGEIDE